MPEGFEVVIDALRSHASALGEVGDLLEEASQSAEETLPSGAYGVLGEALSALLEQLAAKGRDALLASVQCADQMAFEVSTTAQEYQAEEDDVAATMDGMHG
ncbi:type VII secretion target [Actinophytocola sp. NPDC049390]|uniref:type VII secretion target n=1 Tax=Actinophytocola sp. NPDC049390 TaxID=3363894 RepID=UPI0037946552